MHTAIGNVRRIWVIGSGNLFDNLGWGLSPSGNKSIDALERFQCLERDKSDMDL